MSKQSIKLFVMDVDGTLTDGKIYIGNKGEIMKAFNSKDGYGIKDLLPRINGGVTPIVITGRTSKIVEFRCQELAIKYLYQGEKDKTSKLLNILSELELNYNNVLYIGDDDNDLEVMRSIKYGGGLIGAPNDASNAVKMISDYICSLNGGNGAVRELIDWLAKY